MTRSNRQWLSVVLLMLGGGSLLVVAPLVLQPEGDGRDVLYFVLVDRYADGTPDPPGTVDRSDPQAWHGGDLAGLQAHLPDLAQLGVGAVWLSPVSDARTAPHGPWGAYHGYWVEDLRAIEPRFGTMPELAALVEDAHARGLKVYLDVVYNHVAPDAPMVREHPEWFHGLGDVVDWDDPVQAVTHDVHGLPDLAQESEVVYRYLRDASVALVDAVHPDGFRVDAVRHLPEGFLARLGDELRAHQPGFELLGEVYDGSVDRVASRARADRLDAVFDFPLAFAIRDVYCADAPAGKIAALVRADYGGARPVTLVDNHDLPRILSVCGDDVDRVAQALAFQLTARGTPSVTYGTEAGLTGAEEPANRGDMVFDAHHPQGDVLRDLIAWRRAAPSVRSDQTRVVGLSPTAVLFARLGTDETTTIAVNRGTEPLPPVTWTALDAEQDVRRIGGGGSEGWPGRSTRIARHDRAIPPTVGDVALTIEVVAPPLGEGERLVLVGAGERLGAWDPERGVPLGPDGSVTLDVPNGDVLMYKLVALRAGGAEWEAHPDRFLLVTSDRWSGPDACGSLCAPAEAGVARARIAWGDRPLLDALAAGDREAVVRWLAAGADPRATLPDGRTAAEVAADAGDDGAVGLLLAAGARPTAGLLVRAARSAHPRLLALALGGGIPVDAPDTDGVTPLMAAVAAGNRVAVERLLQLGADPARALEQATDPELRARLEAARPAP